MITGLIPTTILLLLVFASVGLLTIGVADFFVNRAVRNRIKNIVVRNVVSGPDRDLNSLPRGWSALIESMSHLAVPAKGFDKSDLRLRFVRAGYRDAAVPRIFFAAKSLFVIGALVVTTLILQFSSQDLPIGKEMLFVLLSAAAAYYFPDFYVFLRTRRRADEMLESLPEFIDLLVICADSGLEMEAAINRVSREFVKSSPALSEEFYLAALEIRAGAGRIAAFKNLSVRVNLPDLYTLVSMLVQSDKLGTSLSDSLRVQSEAMRINRMQRAEEMAAKVPVKMLLPLIMFVFPTLLMVLLGPAVMQIMASFSK